MVNLRYGVSALVVVSSLLVMSVLMAPLQASPRVEPLNTSGTLPVNWHLDSPDSALSADRVAGDAALLPIQVQTVAQDLPTPSFSFLAAGHGELAIGGTVNGSCAVSQAELKVRAHQVAICHADNNPFKGERQILSIRALLAQEHPTLKGKWKILARSSEVPINRTTRPGDTTVLLPMEFSIPSPDFNVNLDDCWLAFEIKIRTDGKEGFSYLDTPHTMFMRGIVPHPGAEKSPATVYPVTTVPVSSGLAIGGSVAGRCEISREGVRVHANQVSITHRDNNPFKGERQILSMSVGLADAGTGGKWDVFLQGPEVAVNRTTRPGDTFLLKDLDFSIPSSRNTVDLNSCWLVFRVRLLTECGEGFSYIHTPRTIFTPAPK